jgi:hypothetical protein
MCNPIRILRCLSFAREERCETFIELNEVLRVFPSLKFVLKVVRVSGRNAGEVNWRRRTVLSSSGLAHPRSTCVSFHTRKERSISIAHNPIALKKNCKDQK